MCEAKRTSAWLKKRKQVLLIAGFCCLLLGGCKRQLPATSEKNSTENHLNEPKQESDVGQGEAGGNVVGQDDVKFGELLIKHLVAGGFHAKLTESKTDWSTFTVRIP